MGLTTRAGHPPRKSKGPSKTKLVISGPSFKRRIWTSLSLWRFWTKVVKSADHVMNGYGSAFFLPPPRFPRVPAFLLFLCTCMRTGPTGKSS